MPVAVAEPDVELNWQALPADPADLAVGDVVRIARSEFGGEAPWLGRNGVVESFSRYAPEPKHGSRAVEAPWVLVWVKARDGRRSPQKAATLDRLEL